MIIFLFLLVAFFAKIASSVTGFGSSTILVPISALLFDIKTAIVLVGLFHFFGEIVDAFLWRRHIIWRIALLFSILGVVFSFIGATLVVSLPARTIQFVLGIFLILYALFSLLGGKISLPKNDWSVISAGGLAGFVAGIIGTAGAIRTAFLSTLNLKKENFLATAFASALLIEITRVSVYYGSGLLKFDLGLWLLVFGVAAAGSLIGRRLVLKISGPVFYKIINLALALAGVKFIFG